MSGFAFKPTGYHGSRAALDGDRVYLSLTTDADQNTITGYVKPEVAALIKVAPELYEVLQRALRDSGCDGDLCMHLWHEQARAALAKVTGESK